MMDEVTRGKFFGVKHLSRKKGVCRAPQSAKQFLSAFFFWGAFSLAPTFSKRKGAINTNVNIAFFFGSKRRKEKSSRPSGVSQKRNAVFAGLRPTTRELLKKLDQNFYPLSLRPSSARDR